MLKPPSFQMRNSSKQIIYQLTSDNRTFCLVQKNEKRSCSLKDHHQSIDFQHIFLIYSHQFTQAHM